MGCQVAAPLAACFRMYGMMREWWLWSATGLHWDLRAQIPPWGHWPLSFSLCEDSRLAMPSQRRGR